MKNIDKLHRIKDFLNTLLREVYDFVDDGLITHIIPRYSVEFKNWTGKLLESRIKELESGKCGSATLKALYDRTPLIKPNQFDDIPTYSIVIIYDKHRFYISSLDGRGSKIDDIFYKICNVESSIYYYGAEIAPTYKRILPMLDYTTDELKLYFRMVL